MTKKNILITGTSRGLGKYMSEKLEKDFQVFGVARSFESSDTLQKQSQLDITNTAHIEDFCEKLAASQVKFDAIVLNAGVGVFGAFASGDAESYREVLETNLVAPILFLQKIFPFLKKDAKIIFIGSIIGKKFLPNGAVYGASKFGLRGFAGMLHKEYPGRVHIIHPKILATDFHRGASVAIPDDKTTSLDSVYEVVRAIVTKTETRFEIDL